MTDDYTVTRWGPEPPPLPQWLADLWKTTCDKIAASDVILAGVKTAPAGPLRMPDLDEIHRIAEQARALRPEGDRFVMASPMLDVVKRISSPAPHQYGGPLHGMSFGIPIVLDERMPDNVIEFRDGDRVIKRIQYGPTEGATCCDLHGRNCEQGGEECCGDCTEAYHFDIGHGGVPCSSPDLSQGAP